MLNEGCNSCASLAGLVLCFIACFILLVIAPLDAFSPNLVTAMNRFGAEIETSDFGS